MGQYIYFEPNANHIADRSINCTLQGCHEIWRFSQLEHILPAFLFLSDSCKKLLLFKSVCVCVFRKNETARFVRSSCHQLNEQVAVRGLTQLNDRPLCQKVTSPLKLQWYEYLTFTSFHWYLIKLRAKLKELDRHNRSLFSSSASVFYFHVLSISSGWSVVIILACKLRESICSVDYSKMWYRRLT